MMLQKAPARRRRGLPLTRRESRRAGIPSHSATRRRRASCQGFTLIELLTVVAIISLLIGILLPSLARARDQAKKAKVLGMLNSIDKALEMFHNDFDQYPDSARDRDPIDWTIGYTGTAMATENNTCHMSGAHWLARALVGHDFRGVDGAGSAMGIGAAPTYASLQSASRKGAYFEGKVFFRDDDAASGLPTATSGTSDFQATGRMIVTDDAFKSPILYYRANERASNPFTNAGTGIYRHADNALITGAITLTPTIPLGWDFAATGKRHQLAPYSFDEADPLPTNINSMPPDPLDSTKTTNTFVRYLFNSSALGSSGGMTIRPMNPDRFVLMSAGKDGIFGTDDDINNFSTR